MIFGCEVRNGNKISLSHDIIHADVIIQWEETSSALYTLQLYNRLNISVGMAMPRSKHP